ncbi:MAG: penicillin-insensitive murein endopeptidase [Thermoleophilia bacterium]
MTSSRSSRRQALHCCPACAASVGGRRRHRGRGPWAWVALLALVAALVPLAAFDGGPSEPSVALAATAPAPDPQPPPPKRPAKKPDPPDRPRIQWRESLALGTPNSGRLQNGVRMPVEWPGLYTYDPQTQRPPGSPHRRWGTAALVRDVLELGEWWARTHPNQPRLGVGDLTPEDGGYAVGHASHENGLDVDIRLPRTDGVEGPADPGTYDRELTQQVVDYMVGLGAQYVFVGPSLDVHGPPGIVVTWPNHDDHLHWRIPDPDGVAN